MDPDAVAKAFVEHYYRTFDSNRSALGGLYQDDSMLTFEGDKILGAAAIVVKLTSLLFQQCAHTICTIDCQPSGPAGGVLVFVSGSIKLGGESDLDKRILFSGSSCPEQLLCICINEKLVSGDFWKAKSTSFDCSEVQPGPRAVSLEEQLGCTVDFDSS